MSVLSLFYGFCTVQNVWLSELYKVHDIIGVVEGWRGGNLPFMSLPPLLLKGGRKWPQIYGKLWYKSLQMAEIGKNVQIIIMNNEKTDKISFETPLWEIAPPPKFGRAMLFYDSCIRIFKPLYCTKQLWVSVWVNSTGWFKKHVPFCCTFLHYSFMWHVFFLLNRYDVFIELSINDFKPNLI